MACMACRAFLWLYWFCLALVTGTYAALSLVSFFNVYRAYGDADEKELRAILATTFFGSVLVVAFTLFTFLIFVGKTILASGAGMGYGLTVSSALHMFISSLLCALVMHGFEDQIKNDLENNEEINWKGIETDTYQATWIMAYISSGIYLVFFFILFLSPRAFHKEERELDEKHEG